MTCLQYLILFTFVILLSEGYLG